MQVMQLVIASGQAESPQTALHFLLRQHAEAKGVKGPPVAPAGWSSLRGIRKPERSSFLFRRWPRPITQLGRAAIGRHGFEGSCAGPSALAGARHPGRDDRHVLRIERSSRHLI